MLFRSATKTRAPRTVAAAPTGAQRKHDFQHNPILDKQTVPQLPNSSSCSCVFELASRYLMLSLGPRGGESVCVGVCVCPAIPGPAMGERSRLGCVGLSHFCSTFCTSPLSWGLSLLLPLHISHLDRAERPPLW